MADKILLEYTRVALEDGSNLLLKEDVTGGFLFEGTTSTSSTEGVLLEDGSYLLLEDAAVALIADGIITTPILATPAISQVHIFSAPPTLTTTPSLATPPLSQVHVLSGNGLTTTPALTLPALTQIHTLAGNGLTTTPSLGTPILSVVISLTANSITVTPVLGTSVVSQNHALTASTITTTPSLGTPTLTEDIGNINLIADSIQSGLPTLGTPSLAQIHALVATGIISGTPEMGTPELDKSIIPECQIYFTFNVCTTINLTPVHVQTTLSFSPITEIDIDCFVMAVVDFTFDLVIED